MRYKNILQQQKAMLQRQLDIKKALRQKYDIDGYISHKKIGQKTYDYLQYRDYNGEIVSVYLTVSDRKIYENALKQRKLIDARVYSLEKDLELFSGVPSLTQKECKVRLDDKYNGYRMLHGAVGVSSRYHALFRVEAKANEHEYIAIATYKKKRYSAPLIYVTELCLSDIPIYMSNAAMVIDDAIRDSGVVLKEKDRAVIKGKTSDGVVYKALRQKVGYQVDFKYRGEHISFMFEPQISDITDDMRRFSFSTKIKEYVKQIDMEKLTKRYYEEH